MILTTDMAINIANDYICSRDDLKQVKDFEDLKQEIYLQAIKMVGAYSSLYIAEKQCIDSINGIIEELIEKQNQRMEHSSNLDIDLIDVKLRKTENEIDMITMVQSIKSIMKRILTEDEYLAISFEYALEDFTDKSAKERIMKLFKEEKMVQLEESALLKIRLELNNSNQINAIFKSLF